MSNYIKIAIEPLEMVQPVQPAKREWVGLTGEEIAAYGNRLSGSGVAKEIEAKLKDRNNETTNNKTAVGCRCDQSGMDSISPHVDENR